MQTTVRLDQSTANIFVDFTRLVEVRLYLEIPNTKVYCSYKTYPVAALAQRTIVLIKPDCTIFLGVESLSRSCHSYCE